MMVAIPDDVCSAALTAIEYLVNADSPAMARDAPQVLAPDGEYEQLQTVVAGLALICEQLVAKFADGYGMNGERLLRQLAGEIVFQHRRLSRRAGTPTPPSVLRLPPQQGTDLWVVRL